MSILTSFFGPSTNNKNNNNKKENIASTKRKTSPKTTQDTIPYLRVFQNGIIETKPNYYTKMYLLKDTNFSVAPEERQETMFLRYEDFINSFDESVDFQTVINIRNIEQDTVLKSVLIKNNADSLSEYRDEYNKMLRDKLNEGRNNLICEKYIIVGTTCVNAEAAKTTFTRIDSTVSNNLKRIVDDEINPLPLKDRLKIIHDLCNIGKEANFNPDQIDLKNIVQQGLTTKDLVAPSSFTFEKDYFLINDKYCRAIYLKNLPTSLSTELLAEISNLPFNLTTSIFHKPIPSNKATKIVKDHLLAINANVVEAHKQASRGGYDPSLISTDLQEAQSECKELLSSLSQRNQRLFLTTIGALIYADTLDELNENTKTFLTLGNRFLVAFDTLNHQQEFAFKSFMPLCHNEISIKRMLTTEQCALFIPFSSQELSQANGMYYGLNAITKNMVLFNRLNSKNYNGLILGIPGSGKSFSAKREMINVLLSTNDDVFVIDPESEYTPVALALGDKIAEVIKLEPGSPVKLNPFDMDIDYAKSDEGGNDPISLKSDFICVLCETMMGSRATLSPTQKTLIDRAVRNVYRPYIEHISTLNGITCDINVSPTMNTFYEELMSMPEHEARNIALAVELYCRGSFNTFSGRTNVNTSKRFVVYDIKNLGTGMKELGLQVCLNHIWNTIVSNKGIRRTWFYIDEFYILTQTESSARFLQQIWKRARKWGGIPTGITQNVEDLLVSEAARGIINNCDFIYMLSQSPIDRASLAELYSLSEEQLTFITDAPAGQGLIKNGSVVIPFIDKFPTNTKLYNIMSTKVGEANNVYTNTVVS